MKKALFVTSLFASLFGIMGALLVALNIGLPHIGYTLFLASSILWVLYSIKTLQSNLLVMNIVFGVINVIGLVNFI